MNINSYERAFNDDVREKKRIANQARYRKVGSKSKKCNLSTDHMTNKQWKERCGEAVTYNLKKPVEWQEFREFPIHVQKEYLLSLIKQYQTTASDLAKMFGITTSYIVKYCKKDDINIRFPRNKRMTEENKEAFYEFCGISNVAHAEETVVVKKEDPETEVVPPETEVPVTFNDAAPSQDMAITEFTLSFSGRFNREMVYNSIASMLPKGTPMKLDIKCVVTP